MTETERNKLKAEIKSELEDLFKKLKTQCQNNYKAWCAILLGIVGSLCTWIDRELPPCNCTVTFRRMQQSTIVIPDKNPVAIDHE